MSTMVYKHIEKQFEVRVQARRGKPVVDKRGMVTVAPPYKKCDRVDVEVFEEKFEKASA